MQDTWYNKLGNWFYTQVTSPSTHNALAITAIAMQDKLPAGYGIWIALGFAFLGITVPEKGEKK
jgi:hypothetical protein